MSLQARWNGLCSRQAGSDRYWTLCVDHRSMLAATAPLIADVRGGIVLDAGAGGLAWRHQLARNATTYLASDYTDTHPDIDFVSDLTAGIPLRDESVDLVFCCSVLEHVKNPFGAMKELARVMRPGGQMILSVPFRYYLHGAPHDYFRFTSYGVQLLAADVGLNVERLQPVGGLMHEITNVISIVAAASLGSGPVGLGATSAVSSILWRLSQFVDRFDTSGRFAQNINVILEKPVDRICPSRETGG